MEEKIASLIYDRVKCSKNIDEVFIKELLNIVISNWNIKKYKGDFEFTDLGMNALGGYSSLYNTISLNPYVLKDNFFAGNYLKICKNDLLSRYLLLTQILLHELVHCTQVEIETDNATDIEQSIIYWSIKPIIDFNKEEFSVEKIIDGGKLKKKLMENYIFSPVERIAQIDSFSITSVIAHELKNDYIETELKRRMFHTHLFYKYENGQLISPTYYYLEKFNCESIKNIRTLEEKETVNDRLRLGLNCTIDEWCSFKNRHEKLLFYCNSHD